MASEKNAKPDSYLSHSQINASEDTDFGSSFSANTASDETRSIAGQSVILGSDETRSEASYSQIHGSDETSSIATLSFRSLSSFSQAIGSDDERSTTPNAFTDGSDETRSLASYSQIHGSDETSTLASLSLRSNVSHIFGSDETWSEASFSLGSDDSRVDGARPFSQTSDTSVSSRRTKDVAGATKQLENTKTYTGIDESKSAKIGTNGDGESVGNSADKVTIGGDEVGGKSADIETKCGDEVGGKPFDKATKGGDEVEGKSADKASKGGDEVGGKSADKATKCGVEVGGKSADKATKGGVEVGGRSADKTIKSGGEVAEKSADIATKGDDECGGQRNDDESEPRHLYSVTGSTDITVRLRSDINQCGIFDICQLPDGRLLMSDTCNDKLKLLDQSYTVIDHCDMPCPPRSVCVCDDEACVGQGISTTLQFVSIQEKMEISRTMKLDHDCRGLVYRDGELYVADGYSNIHVYNKAGNQLRFYNIGTLVDKGLNVEYLTVSMDGIQLYMTSKRYLICIDRQSGEVIWRVKGDNDSVYNGVCVDKDNNVMVCDCKERCEIVQYSDDGDKMGVIVDGLDRPVSICLDQYSKQILVGKWESNVISVFNFKYINQPFPVSRLNNFYRYFT